MWEFDFEILPTLHLVHNLCNNNLNITIIALGSDWNASNIAEHGCRYLDYIYVILLWISVVTDAKHDLIVKVMKKWRKMTTVTKMIILFNFLIFFVKCFQASVYKIYVNLVHQKIRKNIIFRLHRWLVDGNVIHVRLWCVFVKHHVFFDN